MSLTGRDAGASITQLSEIVNLDTSTVSRRDEAAMKKGKSDPKLAFAREQVERHYYGRIAEVGRIAGLTPSFRQTVVRSSAILRYMKYTILLISLAWLADAGCINVYGQTNADCKIRVEGGKYKWKGISPVTTDSVFFGYILVKPKQINKEFLFRLARRLKKEYCGAERLQVVIFDQGKYANPLSQADYLDSGGKKILMRGYYSFDRSKGTELLEFSNKLGNPTTENQFDLTKITLEK